MRGAGGAVLGALEALVDLGGDGELGLGDAREVGDHDDVLRVDVLGPVEHAGLDLGQRREGLADTPRHGRVRRDLAGFALLRVREDLVDLAQQALEVVADVVRVGRELREGLGIAGEEVAVDLTAELHRKKSASKHSFL